MKKKKMHSKQGGLPDDLVVEILSRVPLKSFCRFKCACKAWLAFSSDPHYRRKLPKVPTGLLYRDKHIQLLSLSPNPNDEEIDTIMPDSKKLELVDCCNGLVLCRYKSRRDPSPDTSRLVVYNPATREWRALPVASAPYVPQGILDTIDADHLTDSSLDYTTFLGFDPSWSAEFYVFSFQEALIRSMNAGIIGLEVFDSDMSSCFVDNEWMGEPLVEVGKAHIFVGGVLYVETYSGVILVVQGLEEISRCTDYHSTIKLPDGCEGGGCFGQSSGLLQYAFPEKGGRTIAVFSLDAACKWSMKHRFSMRDAFGRDELVRSRGSYLPEACDYQIVALDLEREVLLLLDKQPKKLLSYNINSRKLCDIKDGNRLLRNYFTHLDFDLDCHYYVACYSKLPR